MKRTGLTPDLLIWTLTKRLKLDARTYFDLTNRPYLLEIYTQTARQIVVKKAAQLGFSEYLLSFVLHLCDERGATCMYVMPTDEDVSDFSQGRLNPAIKASDYLSAIILEGNRGGVDKVKLKQVGDGFLYFRGGKVDPEGKARQLKSVPVDSLALDEIDEMDPRAPSIAEKRLGDSELQLIRKISTPSYAGVGIDAAWAETDRRRWHVCCPRCGQWQYLTKDHLILEWDDAERPVAWHGQAEQRPYLACEKCRRELNRLAPGQWVAEDPDRDVVGYHLSKLFSFRYRLIELIDNLSSTDETKRKETFNQDLGETYTPRGGRITEADLDDCRREYAPGPIKGEYVVAGVDVGKLLNVVIRSRPDSVTGETKQRYAGEVESFEAVGQLLHRYGVKRCVIDAMPETRKAREFQAQFRRGVVWLAYYDEESKLDEAIRWDYKEMIVTIDRTRSLDGTFSRFYEGLSTLPARIRGVANYYKQMAGLVRVTEINRRRGNLIARYVRSTDDHFAHAENYCDVARQGRSASLR